MKRFPLFIFVVLQVYGQGVLVKSSTYGPSKATQYTDTLPWDVATGNWLGVQVASNAMNNVLAVQANSGAFTLARAGCAEDTTKFTELCLYYLENTPATIHTIAVKTTNSVNSTRIIFEMSGLAKTNSIDMPLAPLISAFTTGNTWSTAEYTTNAYDTVISGASQYYGFTTSPTWSAGSGFLINAVGGNTPVQTMTQYQVGLPYHEITSSGKWNGTGNKFNTFIVGVKNASLSLPVAAITLGPQTLHLDPGQQRRLDVTASYSNGQVADIAGACSWKVATLGGNIAPVVEMTTDGSLIALATGTASVQCSALGIMSSSVLVTVSIPGSLTNLPSTTTNFYPYTKPPMPDPGNSFVDAHHTALGQAIEIERLPAIPSTCSIQSYSASYAYPPNFGIIYNSQYWVVPYSAGVHSTPGIAPPKAPWQNVSHAQACQLRGLVPSYSQRPAWNADNSEFYMIGLSGGNAVYFYKSDPVAFDFELVNPQIAGNNDDETWSHTDPHVMYFMNSNVVPATMNKVDIRSRAVTTVHTFDISGTECPTGTLFVRNGGSGNPSRDDRYWAMSCKVGTGATDARVIVYDRIQNKVVSKRDISAICALYGGKAQIDWLGMSPSGNYVVIAWNAPSLFEDTWHGCTGVELFDKETLTSRGMIFTADGHNDVGYDVNGDEVMVAPHGSRTTTEPLSQYWAVNVTRLKDVVPRPVNGSYPSDAAKSYVRRYYLPCSFYSLQKGSDPYNGCTGSANGIEYWHVSGRATETANSQGWFLMSSYSFNQNPAAELSGWGRSENVALEIDASLPTMSNVLFRRISRNLGSRYGSTSAQCSDSQDYWQEPHATVNRDFTALLFGSSWLSECGQVGAFIVKLPQQ